ncbi:MAG: ferritin family protein [Planctomycetota bacterium]
MDNTKIDFTRLSVMDALDLAILIEQEAEERYVTFAEMIGSRYEGDAAAFFQTMSGYEAKHCKKLQERRTKLFANTPMLVNKEMVESVEAPDYGTPRPFMSTRHALEVALDSERKAEAFYVSALTVITEPQVQGLFTELRNQEIEHQEMVQQQIAKTPGDMDPDVAPEDVDTPEL